MASYLNADGSYRYVTGSQGWGQGFSYQSPTATPTQAPAPSAPVASPEPQAPSLPQLSPFIRPRTSAWNSPIPVSVGRRVIAFRMLDLDENRRQQGVSTETGLTYSHVGVQYSGGYSLLDDASERHVRRGWAFGRKFFDLDAGFVEPGWEPAVDWLFQPGDQTTPHPYFEALRGTDAAPAYQRQMVATFPNMSLEFFAEEIPSITLEVWDDNAGTRPLVKDIITLLAQRATLYDPADLVFVGMDDLEITGAIFEENIDFKAVLPLFARFCGFDWFEAGGKLKCVKRADADFDPDVVLDVRDLIASSNEGGFKTSRRDEEELPAQIAISYYDESIQFKPSVQQARLEQEPARVVQSRRQESLSVPFVVSATEAMTAASHILDRESAQAISHGPVQLPPSHIALEPADLLQIDDGTHSFVMKASSVTINSDNSISVQAFGVSTSVDYTREGYAGEPPGAPLYPVPVELEGSAAGAGGAAGTLSVGLSTDKNLTGAVSGTGAAAGTLSQVPPTNLIGDASGTGAAAGTMTKGFSLSGDAAGSGQAAGAIASMGGGTPDAPSDMQQRTLESDTTPTVRVFLPANAAFGDVVTVETATNSGFTTGAVTWPTETLDLTDISNGYVDVTATSAMVTGEYFARANLARGSNVGAWFSPSTQRVYVDTRSNVTGRSIDFADTGWTANGQQQNVSVTSVAGAPDGGNFARVKTVAGGSQTRLATFTASFSSHNKDSIFYFKPGSAPHAYLHTRVNDAGNKGRSIDTTTGATGAGVYDGTTATAAVTSILVCDAGQGWKRVRIRHNGSTGNIYFAIAVSDSITNTNTTVTDDTTDFWQVMMKNV